MDMSSSRRFFAGLFLAAVLMICGGMQSAQAQLGPALVVYGAQAKPVEGDPDFQQEIYISVPADYQGRLYLRLFDPDTNHRYDTPFGIWGDTRTRFSLLGGDGAAGKAGKTIKSRVFGSNRRLDGRWTTFAAFKPGSGELKGDIRIFRLDVKGLRGNDGNIFDVTVSKDAKKNIPVDGVKVTTFRPTVRVPDDKLLTELKFRIPKDATSLTFNNFDAADADLKLTYKNKSQDLKPSGQGVWLSEKIDIAKQDRGQTAAITVRLGTELPNDVTFYIKDANGADVPIELPIRALVPNTRPIPVVETRPQSCSVMKFNGGNSIDADGHELTYLWRFPGEVPKAGVLVSNSYPKPGRYKGIVEVTDNSTQIGNGAQKEFTFDIKAKPVARIKVAANVARGVPVPFDASGSTTGAGFNIATYFWDFGDGASGNGPNPNHIYAKPGKYLVRLWVRDASGHPCDSASDSFTVTVNERPVADAGPDRTVIIGEQILFDGSRSRDGDGAITHYAWDFGDNSQSQGKTRPHSYWQKGTYRVKLTVKDNSALENDRHDDVAVITVTDRPNTPPVADPGPIRNVIAGQLIEFDGSKSHDPDGSLLEMKWNFGNGDTAVGIAPRYAYAKPGSYTVKLTVRDASGLANDTTSSETVVVVDHPPNLPPVSKAGPDVSSAIDQIVNYDASASRDPDGNIIRYDWDFGDGTKGRGIRTAHAYKKSGLYTVTLTTTDGSGRPNAQTSDTRVINVNEPPVANAGPNQLVTASEVQFDGTASKDADGKIAKYSWTFGDGTQGEGPKPRHVYRKPGTYKVGLIVGDDSGTIRNTAQASMQVIVNATPIADAGPDIIAAPGEEVTFDGSSSVDPDGEIKRWQWEFRDGAKADGKIVKHRFEKPGTYIVQLKVTDQTGHENAIDFAETRVVINEQPVARAGSDIRAAPGDEITFNASQSFDRDGKIANYRWDFSDKPDPVSGAVVNRSFDNPGLYNVQLTVVDNSSAANGVAKDELTVAINHAPVAEAGPDIVSSQLRVVFDGTASADADGDGLSFHWDFGDGNSATGARVAHTYKTGGKYPVVLKVNDGTGLKNATALDTLVTRVNRAPLAVAGANRNVCTGDVVVFDGSGSSDPENGVLRYSWDFGDGTKSDIVNPAKKFVKPGDFPVTLTVQDDSGLKNARHSDRAYVRVNQAPVAAAGDDILACTNVPVQFDGTKSFDLDGVVNRYTWDFGDGNLGGGDRPKHNYTRPGTYRVTLNIEGDQVGQCSPTATDQLSVRVIQAPIAVIKAPNAAPLGADVAFDGSGSSDKDGKVTDWLWSFGDGTSANGAKVKHAFRKPGLYRVELTIKSATAAPACQTITTSQVIAINAPPVAEAGQDIQVSVGEAVQFDAGDSYDADGGISAFSWDFGDGNKGKGLQPVHAYVNPGKYKVKLTVKDTSNLPNDTVSDTLTVTVMAPPLPPITGPAVACVREPVTWQAGLAGGAATKKPALTWLLGDGTKSADAQVTHTYQRAGKYNVTLFVDETQRLENSRRHISKTLHVNHPPRALAGPDQLGCAGQTLTFDGTRSNDPDGKLTAIKWDFGDGNTADQIKATHKFDKPGTYKVALTVRDDANSSCSIARDELTVVVNAPPVAKAGDNLEAFIGGANDAVLFDGSKSSDPDGSNLTYRWDVGRRVKLSGARVKHLFRRAGSVPVKLTVNDGTGLSCGIASETITVNVRSRAKN